jgi:hypothetical protein
MTHRRRSRLLACLWLAFGATCVVFAALTDRPRKERHA